MANSMGRALAVQPARAGLCISSIAPIGFLGAVPIVGSTIAIESGLPSALYWRDRSYRDFFGEARRDRNLSRKPEHRRSSQTSVVMVCREHLYFGVVSLSVRQAGRP